MRSRTIVIALLLWVAGGLAGSAAEKPDADAAAAFSKLAALAGEWKTDDGKASLTYEVIAGGTTILERETGEGRPPMLTLYHRDGGRLLLTHYCMAGNQPRMAARPFDAATGELVFDFIDATNLSSPDAGHMRTVKIRFLDADRIESEWQFYENRKPTMTERARYARVR
jgi:hypothetical protein